MFLAVIRRGARVLRDRHNHFGRDRRDRQLSRIRFFDDVVTRLVYRSNRTFRKLCRIFADKRSRRANFDRAEIRAFRRSSKAGNALRFSIIRKRGAVRCQRDVLIIVENKNIIFIVSANLDL